ncbi:MAG: cell division protein FtsA [Candidatus Omnitrophica bacterium]|nr:cell division protein FtsA [Candidatus Omnitrophota bacterium]
MIKEKIYCGLDLGCQKIKASIMRVQKGQSDLLGVSQLSTQGLANSSVSDLRELCDCIHTILSGLTKKTGVKVKNVNLGFGGHLVESRESHVVLPLTDKGSKVITSFDLRRINHQACLLGVELDERLFYNFPTKYLIDGFNVATNPLGLYGRKLESDSLLLVAKNNLVNNMYKAVNQAGFEVSNVFFSSLSAAKICLSAQQKRDGCLFISIGTTATDLLFFKDSTLKTVRIISWGGDHLTNEISSALGLPFDLTEDIKRSYAVVPDCSHEGQEGEVLVKRDAGYIPIQRSDISKAICSSIEEFISQVCLIIKEVEVGRHLLAGIVMSGGGSLLPGLMERVEKETKLLTHMGKVGVESKRLSSPPIYAASIGLAQESRKDLSDNIFSSSGRASAIRRFSNRAKEIYQEYF